MLETPKIASLKASLVQVTFGFDEEEDELELVTVFVEGVDVTVDIISSSLFQIISSSSLLNNDRNLSNLEIYQNLHPIIKFFFPKKR